MKRFIPFFALSLLSSCGSSDDSRPHQLGKLRILAVVADKPEVQPGTTVQISPVVSFPDVASRTLTHEAWGCLDPGLSVGATPTCANAADKVSLMAPTALTLSAPNYTQSLSNIFSFAAPSDSLSAFDTVTAYNGESYIVEYIVRASTGEVANSIKRIRLTTKTLAEWNSNPSLTNIMSTSGSALSVLPTATTTLFPNYPGASKQAYTLKNSSGNLVSSFESLTTSWYVTRGTFNFDRTDSANTNTFSPNGAGPTGAVTMVVVLHDNRGGMVVTILSL